MSLAEQQAELVRALVAGGPLPPGFAEGDLTAAKSALLRKRAGEVAQVWPSLSGAHGGQWAEVFAGWAQGRAPQGSLRDGWDFARANPPGDRYAQRELAIREVTWHYDGQSAPRRRRLPAVRRVTGKWLLQLAGRVRG